MLSEQNLIDKTFEFISLNGYEGYHTVFLQKTAKFLIDLLELDFVIVDKFLIDYPEKINTVVFHSKDEVLPNLTYELKNTPCESVLNKKTCVYPKDVQNLFPLDIFLKKNNINSYIGVPLWSSNMKPIGLIALMSKEPIKNHKEIVTVLQIIALKVEKVLDKILFEEELSKNEKKLKKSNFKIVESELKFKQLSNLTFEGILIHENGIAKDVNLSFEKMFGYTREELINCDMIDLLFPKKYHQLIRQNIKDEYTTPYEIKAKRKDGSIFPVEIEARFINLKNNSQRVTALRDVSKRKKQEDENLKLKKAVEQSDNIIVITDTKGNIEYTNPKFTNVTGYSAEEALGKNPRILNSGFHPKDYYKELWETICSDKIWSGQFRNISKKGVISWEQATISPIKNSDGEIVNFIAIKADITEKKNAEKKLTLAYQELEDGNKELKKITQKLVENNTELFETKNRFKNLFNNSPVSLWDVDFSEIIQLIKAKNIDNNDLEYYLDNNLNCLNECIGKIVINKVNKKTLSLFGVKDIEGLKKLLVENNKNELLRTVKKEIVAILLNLKDYSFESNFVNSKGENISAIVNSEIEPNGKVIISINDITSLKKAKKEIEKSERKFRDLFEKSGDGILIIKNGIFVDCNQAIVSMLKYKNKEDFLNSRPSQLSPKLQLDGEESLKKEEKMMNIALKKGSHRFEWLHIKSNGDVFPVEVLLTTIANTSKEKIIHCVWRDITQRKKVSQDLIEAKEKAEESNRLKTEFLNNMSHEIRTPMNGIMGFSELLKNEYLTPAKRKYYVGIIENSSKQLLHIIDDILEISSLGTHQVKVEENEINLNDLLFELFSVFGLKAKEKKIPLYLKNSLKNKDSLILTDAVKLTKILSNLLENALKFTNKGQISFGYVIVDDKIELFVKDTGIGILPSKQKTIFERFSREENSFSKASGGLGLGLSIAKENTELLGGKIEVISEVLKGSTFKITIPYKQAKKPHATIKNENSIKKKYNILIVEDDEVNCLFLEILLNEQVTFPCNISIVHNGKEAVDKCIGDSSIDLVLMDINMPVMDGYEATKIIKERFPLIPVVAQTAYSSLEDKGKALNAGCNDFLTKPIKLEELNKVLSKFLK